MEAKKLSVHSELGNVLFTVGVQNVRVLKIIIIKINKKWLGQPGVKESRKHQRNNLIWQIEEISELVFSFLLYENT